MRGLWRYNHTSSYIVKRVAATAGQEGLTGYRANGSACAAAASGGAVLPDAAALAGNGLAVRPCMPHWQ